VQCPQIGKLLFRDIALGGVIDKNQMIVFPGDARDRMSGALGTIHFSGRLVREQ
jgi:hypothetical protein